MNTERNQITSRAGYATGLLVHLHSSHWTPGDPPGCPTVCGLDCGTVDTACQGLDPERVTCPTCLPSVGKARRIVVRVPTVNVISTTDEE